MKVGPRALALIKSFEGVRLQAYLPTKNDRPTIGYGATFYADGQPVRMGDRCTQDQADALLDGHVQHFAHGVERLLGTAPTNAAQFGAMVALAFNIGIGAFGKSSVLRLHKLGKHALAADAFALWNKQAGRVLAGLTRRRAAEAALYRSLP